MPSQRPSTARARLVAELTQEILSRNDQSSFPIASEHQLCRRFNVSRVTVRLALSDLENRGLIYRKHGKGTFAHGSSSRIHRHLGILLKSPHSIRHRPNVELIQGAQSTMASLRAGFLLITTPPEEWRPEKASSLGGVIVVPQDVTVRDLEVLQNRNLPFLIATESDLPGPHINLGLRAAAKHMTEQLLRGGHRRIALFSGYDICLDTPKRLGIHDALREAGLDPGQLIDISINLDESRTFDMAREIMRLRPRPTAVIGFDDSLAVIVRLQAVRLEKLNVPGDMSIVSFHDWPYINHSEPVLSSVHFEFYCAGQRAADALSRAALTGDPMTDIFLEPSYPPGQTIGPAPSNA